MTTMPSHLMKDDDIGRTANLIAVVNEAVRYAVFRESSGTAYPHLLTLERQRYEADSKHPTSVTQGKRDLQLALHLLGPSRPQERIAAELRLLQLSDDVAVKQLISLPKTVEITSLLSKLGNGERFEAVVQLTVVVTTELDEPMRVVDTITITNALSRQPGDPLEDGVARVDPERLWASGHWYQQMLELKPRSQSVADEKLKKKTALIRPKPDKDVSKGVIDPTLPGQEQVHPSQEKHP